MIPALSYRWPYSDHFWHANRGGEGRVIRGQPRRRPKAPPSINNPHTSVASRGWAKISVTRYVCSYRVELLI